VPYLLDRLNDSLVVPLAAPRPIAGRSAEESIGGATARQRSRYRLDLPFARLPGATLVLETSERVFDRRVMVAVQDPPAASDQPRRAPGERVIASASWRHTDPDSAAGPLRLALPPLPVSALVLIVDEGDNRPLPLARPTLQLPAYRLRFFRDAGAVLTLVYGQPGLSAPRYDLALAASRLAGRAVRTAALGPEREVPHVARHTPLVVFWCALVIAITLLLVLLARLLRQGASPPAAAPADARAAPPSSTD
jgi:hypothetical protein